MSVAVATPVDAFRRADDPNGLAFERVSDAVDDINVAKLQATKDAYDDSTFDADKEKAGFRQFVDSNESSRRFYMYVHISVSCFDVITS